MNKLFAFLFLLICLVYVRFVLQTNPNFEIINAPISKVNPQYLFEKQPLVIHEPLVKPMDLLGTLFKYLYIRSKHESTTPGNVYQQNRNKYIVLYPRKNGLSLHVVHPKKTAFLKDGTKESLKHVDFVEFKLKKKQVVILPMYWWYKTNSEKFGRIEIDDILSLLLTSS